MPTSIIVFIVAMCILGLVAWLLYEWLEERRARRFGPEARRTIELLTGENDRLHGQMSRLEERIAVLERIATDAPARLGHEIDALR